ncbi:MAG: YheC/YheD family protein [Bacillaceae bacterium]|nr:YheC/YheD family protein [Bacillaceae bacterium]
MERDKKTSRGSEGIILNMFNDRWDKWNRYQVLKQDRDLNPYLPDTDWLTREKLQIFLRKYGPVYLKPAASSDGRGIIVVESRKDNGYFLITESKREVLTEQALWMRITEEIIKDYIPFLNDKNVDNILARSYLIQQRIWLAKMQNRIFDIRVMVQKKKGSPWVVTGKLAKVAKGNDFLTNSRTGSEMLTVEQVCRETPSLNEKPTIYLTRLDDVAIRAAYQLDRHYQKLRIIGFDMCFDQNGKLWIVEANFQPNDRIFLQLKDQTAYQLIQDFKRDA